MHRNKKRENICPPEFPTSLPGSFWGITTFFNPAGYKSKYENYRIFRDGSRKQGLNLIALELSFYDHPFELKEGDAEILIHIRGGEKNMLWQKERLLNIGLKRLPADCDKVAWVDCDIIFKNDNWIKETSNVLERYIAVQPFRNVVFLPKGRYEMSMEEMRNLPPGVHTNEQNESAAYTFFSGKPKNWMVGFSQAIRREVIDKIGFYDRLILGSADSFMFYSFCGEDEKLLFSIGPKWDNWSKRAYGLVRKSVHYTEGVIFHTWHGKWKNRQYVVRRPLYDYYKVKPSRDLKINQDGIWEWLPEDRKLNRVQEAIMLARQEDGDKKDLTTYLFNEFSRVVRELITIKGSISYNILKAMGYLHKIIMRRKGKYKQHEL